MALQQLMCRSVKHRTRFLYFGSNPVRIINGFQNKSMAVNVAAKDTFPKIESTWGSMAEHPKVNLSFANAQEAYKSKTNWELLRAYLVFQICSIQPIVNHNKILMKMCRSLFGAKLFHKLMKATFYGHFVAGEDRIAIRPLVNRNKQFGVKSILDYSAEKDVSTEHAVKTEMNALQPENQTKIAKDDGHQQFQVYKKFADRREGVISSRVYFYEGEEQCDRNMQIFLDSIDGVADATNKTGLCAIKLTALGRPQLLLQMSDVLVSARKFFVQLCGEDHSSNGDKLSRGFDKKDFIHKLELMGVKMTPEESNKWFSILDMSQDGQVDYMDWDNLLEVNMSLSKLFVVPDPKTGQLKKLMTHLSEETEAEMKNMLQRMDKVASYAKEKDVRVMVDAEQSYFQPAINRLTMEMMKKYNREKAIVFNTYQCYLKAAYDIVQMDLDTARRNNIYFSAKLVRGAYMEQERERAATIGYEDPINPTYEATSEMYHKVLDSMLLEAKRQEKGRVSVMVASHNEDTVKFTVGMMKVHGIQPTDKVVCFGQLLGMCDQISFPLGQAGYSVYKYVPYGPIDEVLPYLSRRAMENRGVLQKVKKEKSLLRQEIVRRLLIGQLRYDPMKNVPNLPTV